jgi:hypothetical protein
MDGWVGKWVNVRVVDYLTILYQLYLNIIGTVYLEGNVIRLFQDLR